MPHVGPAYWFVAESYSAALGTGYRQTIFTTHAPSMKARIEMFDHEFESLLKDKKLEGPESGKLAIEYIGGEIARLKKDLEGKERKEKIIE